MDYINKFQRDVFAFGEGDAASNKKELELEEEDIKNQLRDELFSLQNEKGFCKLNTDEIEILSESIYKNVFLASTGVQTDPKKGDK